MKGEVVGLGKHLDASLGGPTFPTVTIIEILTKIKIPEIDWAVDWVPDIMLDLKISHGALVDAYMEVLDKYRLRDPFSKRLAKSALYVLHSWAELCLT